MILLLCAASNFFGAVFSRLGSAMLLTKLLLALQLDPMLMLIAIMALIFVLGWPLEWVPIVLIIIPILMPMVRESGYNLTWFCTLVAITLQTAWLSPPVALSAYFLKGVVPQWALQDIYSGMVQFMGVQMIGMAIVLTFPALRRGCRRRCASETRPLLEIHRRRPCGRLRLLVRPEVSVLTDP